MFMIAFQFFFEVLMLVSCFNMNNQLSSKLVFANLTFFARNRSSIPSKRWTLFLLFNQIALQWHSPSRGQPLSLSHAFFLHNDSVISVKVQLSCHLYITAMNQACEHQDVLLFHSPKSTMTLSTKGL